MHHFTLPPKIHENFSCSTSSVIINVIHLYILSYSVGYGVLHHCGFNLNISNNFNFLDELIDHLDKFFWECLFKLCPYLVKFLVFLLLSCKSLHILNTSTLSDMFFEYSLQVYYLPINFLSGIFDKIKIFFNLMKTNINVSLITFYDPRNIFQLWSYEGIL